MSYAGAIGQLPGIVLPVAGGGMATRAKPLSAVSGYVQYQFSYRGYIDTPFAQASIWQHQVGGVINAQIKGFPVRVGYLMRKSNSIFFRDIADVQVAADMQAYKTTLHNMLLQQLLARGSELKDSLLVLDYKQQLSRVSALRSSLTAPDLLQKLADYRELTELPELLHLPGIGDSANRRRVDSILPRLRLFTDSVAGLQAKLSAWKDRADSLEKRYQAMTDKIKQYEAVVRQQLSGKADLDQLARQLRAYGMQKAAAVPARFRWLMNLQRFAAGRSMVNYSELTSKNMTLTGINMAYYPGKYYVAVAAGLVDFRYRDLIAGRRALPRQYMYMVRVGRGREEGSHFYVSLYRGQKQVPAAALANKVMTITGVAAELKIRLNERHWLLAEVAESVAPDFRLQPVRSSKIDWSDNKNKALAMKWYSYWPKTQTKLEGLYKYTGANFQSFSSFQPNAALRSWHIKADQYFFRRKLKLAAALRTNDFSNPYIVLPYRSNMVFKSVQLSYRAKGMPTISAGYMPVSQLTRLDEQVVENQFNSLTATVAHFYKLGTAKGATMVLYNRFFNAASDTGFAYFNAANVYVNQSVSFSRFSLTAAVLHSSSTGYELNVLEGGLQLTNLRMGSAGMGIKVNNFNRLETKAGVYANLQLNLRGWGMLQASYDNGFIPAANKKFVQNDLLTVAFTKSF